MTDCCNPYSGAGGSGGGGGGSGGGGGDFIPFSIAGDILAQGATIYAYPGGTGSNTTEVQMYLGKALTLTQIAINLVTAWAGTANFFTVTVRKNGVNTALAVSLAAGAHHATFSASVTFAVGDLLSISVSAGTTFTSAKDLLGQLFWTS